MKKIIGRLFVVVCLALLFTGCSHNVKTENTKKGRLNPDYSNPDYGLSRTASLDFIFNNQTMGTTIITMKRSEWNKLCDNYRYFYKNENYVHVEKYDYQKDGKSWTLCDVGLKLRGNTSRYCPQGIDNGREQGQMNADWNKEYYDYASRPNNDYRQSHFKVDFEEFLDDDDEQKMAGCMKGVCLKRMDGSCTREIFCYDLFHHNGIWSAPRASHTRLIYKFIEDETTNNITTVNFGVYEMFEDVNKQSLKARDSENNSDSHAWKNNKGYLWKCQSDLKEWTIYSMGIEDIKIYFRGENSEKNNVRLKDDGKGRIGYSWEGYGLDLKTNKEDFEKAKDEFSVFVTDLNNLPNPANENDTAAINKIKAFYEKWFDLDFFLKTYAVSILCGMDDDYWGNANNFYLYFDTGKKGSGKVYYIPFDYDNTMGNSIFGEDEKYPYKGFLQNPLEWGRGKDRPLMDKLLSVPEYKTKFAKYLLEVCNNEYWTYERCSKLFNDWCNMCSPYLNSPDLNYTGLGVQGVWTKPWQNFEVSLVDKSNNIYDATRESFERWLSSYKK